MKINHNCIEYRLSQHLAVWEIETEEAYEYYVEVKGYPIAFSFGSSKENKNPRMSEGMLTTLMKQDYFRPTLENIVLDYDELKPLYNELNVPRIDVYCSGSCFWEADMEADGGIYVVNNCCPNRLQFYAVDNRKCDDLFMMDDMIFDLDRSELQDRAKEIYKQLRNELYTKSVEWDFDFDLEMEI